MTSLKNGQLLNTNLHSRNVVRDCPVVPSVLMNMASPELTHTGYRLTIGRAPIWYTNKSTGLPQAGSSQNYSIFVSDIDCVVVTIPAIVLHDIATRCTIFLASDPAYGIFRRNTHLCTWVLERSGFEPVHTYKTVHTGSEQANRSEMVDSLGLLMVPLTKFKGSLTRNVRLQVFHESVSLCPLNNLWGNFEFLRKFAEIHFQHLCVLYFITGVVDTGD